MGFSYLALSAAFLTMCALFRNKYHIGSIRYRGHDYSGPGMYYVTICTKNKTHYFGEILNGEMILSEIGKIVNDEWIRTFEIRCDMNIKMDDYIIMPDHFHAIIAICENQYNQPGMHHNDDGIGRDAMHRVSTTTTTTTNDTENKNSFGPQSKNLASIIRGFKSAVTVRALNIDPGFAWQSKYYDHIIRTNIELTRIRNYIINNPTKWAKNCK